MKADAMSFFSVCDRASVNIAVHESGSGTFRTLQALPRCISYRGESGRFAKANPLSLLTP